MLNEHELQHIAVGYYGVEVIADTATHTGNFGILVPLEDSVIDTIVCPMLSGSLAGEILPKGVPIHLIGITSIKLTSGSLLAHKTPPNLL